MLFSAGNVFVFTSGAFGAPKVTPQGVSLHRCLCCLKDEYTGHFLTDRRLLTYFKKEVAPSLTAKYGGEV